MNRQIQLNKTLQLVLVFSILFSVLIQAEQKPDLNGRWKCVVRGLISGELEADLLLKHEGKNITGSLTTDGYSFTLSQVTLESEEIQFTVTTDEHQYNSKAKLIEGKLVGIWKDEAGNEGKWEARREELTKN